MTILEESFALVFLISFDLENTTWIVRIKCAENAGSDHLEIVNAKSVSGIELSGGKWEDLAAEHGLLESFWAEAFYQYIIRQGGDVGQA